MKLFSLAAVVAAGLSAPVSGAEQLRGWRWQKDNSDDADAAPKGDYMDQYIASSKSDNGGAGGVWWKSDAQEPKKPSAPSAESSASDVVSWIHSNMNRQREEWHMPRADDLFGSSSDGASARGAGGGGGGASAARSSGRAARSGGRGRQQQQQQQQQGGSASGAVVSIRLDSELQMKKKQAAMVQASTRSAPDVESAVAQQRLQDVYIHDTFSSDAAADDSEVSELEASRFFKA